MRHRRASSDSIFVHLDDDDDMRSVYTETSRSIVNDEEMWKQFRAQLNANEIKTGAGVQVLMKKFITEKMAEDDVRSNIAAPRHQAEEKQAQNSSPYGMSILQQGISKSFTGRINQPAKQSRGESLWRKDQPDKDYSGVIGGNAVNISPRATTTEDRNERLVGRLNRSLTGVSNHISSGLLNRDTNGEDASRKSTKARRCFSWNLASSLTGITNNLSSEIPSDQNLPRVDTDKRSISSEFNSSQGRRKNGLTCSLNSANLSSDWPIDEKHEDAEETCFANGMTAQGRRKSSVSWSFTGSLPSETAKYTPKHRKRLTKKSHSFGDENKQEKTSEVLPYLSEALVANDRNTGDNASVPSDGRRRASDDNSLFSKDAKEELLNTLLGDFHQSGRQGKIFEEAGNKYVEKDVQTRRKKRRETRDVHDENNSSIKLIKFLQEMSISTASTEFSGSDHSVSSADSKADEDEDHEESLQASASSTESALYVPPGWGA